MKLLILKSLMSLLVYCSLALPAYADVKVGTVYFYPPFVLSAKTGFDIQFMQIICQNLHEDCTFKPMDYNKLYTALDSGEIDIAIGGITIASAGSANYIYSLPYILSKGEFLGLKSSKINSIADLGGHKVGIVRGSRDGGVLYEFLTSSYPDQFKIVKFDEMDDLITALSNEDISAAFTHESTALYWELNGGGKFKLIDKPMSVGNGIGIMSTPKEMPLIEKINQEIRKIEKDKIYLKLYDIYFASET